MPNGSILFGDLEAGSGPEEGGAFLISHAYNSSSVPSVAWFSLDFKNVCVFKSPNDTIHSLRIETGSCKCWVDIKYPTNVSLIEYNSSVSAKYFY